jgi:hypothetical protein
VEFYGAILRANRQLIYDFAWFTFLSQDLACRFGARFCIAETTVLMAVHC